MVTGQRVGYIRVSSLGQNPERQLDGRAVQDCHDHAGELPYQPTVMTIGSWALAHGLAALTVDGPLTKWITHPDDLITLATTIIHNFAHSLYQPQQPRHPN